MTTIEIEREKAKLYEITSTMDIPDYRRDSVKWLARNMCIRNSGHPQFEAAMEIVTRLNKMGVA